MSVARVNAVDLGAATVRALTVDAVVAQADAAVLELIGPGAVAAFQGLLTNDIEQPGDGAFVYGALLTPKGMIVVDGWAARLGATVCFTVPARAREAALGLFAKWVPPRLARHHDRTTETAVLRVAGPRGRALLEAAHVPIPTEAERVVRGAAAGVAVEVARPTDMAPFALQISLARAEAPAVLTQLAEAGVVEAPAAALDVLRILAGWPALAAEVDERTLPQEVRLDEIGGVSYTKGCYTGQETVSRLHFRGHANRLLRGLAFHGDPGGDDSLAVTHEGRETGRVTSVLALPDGWLGLGILRREVATGTEVRAGGAVATVVDLPFSLPWPGPA